MDEHLELLKKYKFDKQIKKLNKSLKGKSIVIYGAGTFFKKIKDNYDISNLNIIGISDLKYTIEQEGQLDMGYKIIPKDKIVEYNPDVILLATLKTFTLYKTFKQDIFKDTKIKIFPLVDKPFFELLKEVFA